ncbi:MAG: hypothetical protein E6K66_08040, partial [Nitrospirae bacterium]
MSSPRTAIPGFLKTPKIHLPICSLSFMALFLLTTTVSAEQNALEREAVDYLHPQKYMQQKPKPTLKELVEACAAIVRKDTNERLTSQASQFDAYVTADGSVADLGT